jgi:hypothetical protein
MYKQTTFETCLACCLLEKAGIRPTKHLEMKMIKHSLQFSRINFVAGHLDFMERAFSKKFKRLAGKKVTIRAVDSLIDKKPAVYVDCFMFRNWHMPHFITVLDFCPLEVSWVSLKL